MARIAGLRIAPSRLLPEPDPEVRRTLVLMREAASGNGRRMVRQVERLCSRALVLQDYAYLDRLHVRDEMWSTTGPSVASDWWPASEPWPA